MPWVRIDDGFPHHPKFVKAGPLAQQLLVAAICHCNRYLTDGRISMEELKALVSYNGIYVDDENLPGEVGTPHIEDVAEKLIRAGALEYRDGEFAIHDYLDYQPSRALVLRDRERDRFRASANSRKKVLAAVRLRDGDDCRYCGKVVVWTDRRSAKGGTYDHVDPMGPNTPENLVVACRACNSAKKDRTPEQAGMPLLEPRGSGASSSGTNPNSKFSLTDVSGPLAGDLPVSQPLEEATSDSRGAMPRGPLDDWRSVSQRLRDADAGTPAVLAAIGRGLPEAAIARALESLEQRRRDTKRGPLVSEVRYFVASLKRIRDELRAVTRATA